MRAPAPLSRWSLGVVEIAPAGGADRAGHKLARRGSLPKAAVVTARLAQRRVAVAGLLLRHLRRGGGLAARGQGGRGQNGPACRQRAVEKTAPRRLAPAKVFGRCHLDRQSKKAWRNGTLGHRLAGFPKRSLEPDC